MEHPALLEEARLHALGRHSEANSSSTAADAEFEAILAESIPDDIVEKSFYTSIAGTSHRNVDGSSRGRILARCGIFDGLTLRPEPENEFDSNAIAVCVAKSGEQLGYLEARLAAEVTLDRRKHSDRWMAVFRHHNYDPEHGHVVGGVIYIICLDVDYVTEKEREAQGESLK
jgi:hypothetical protein